MLMVVGGLCGLIAIGVGLRQMFQGINGIFGSDSGLTRRINELVEQANKQAVEGGALLQQLLQAVDEKGLDTVRQSRAADLQRAQQLLTQAAAALREAADKVVEQGSLGGKELAKEYANAKAESYRQGALTKDGGREMAQAIMDPEVKSTDKLLERIGSARSRVDQADAASKEWAARADAIRAQHPELFK